MGGVIDVIVYLKLYARPVAMKLEEMYQNFYNRHRFMPVCVVGAVIPNVINFLQTVLRSAPISSRGNFIAVSHRPGIGEL